MDVTQNIKFHLMGRTSCEQKTWKQLSTLAQVQRKADCGDTDFGLTSLEMEVKARAFAEVQSDRDHEIRKGGGRSLLEGTQAGEGRRCSAWRAVPESQRGGDRCLADLFKTPFGMSVSHAGLPGFKPLLHLPFQPSGSPAPGTQQVLAQVVGSLILVWEICIEFLPVGVNIAHPNYYGHLGE